MPVVTDKNKKAYLAWKRASDVALSAVGSVITLPLLMAASLAIMAEDPTASPIFVQERVGRDGKTFRMYKLRTMYKDAEAQRESLAADNEADGPVFKKKDDPRITKVGRLLRKSYVDELPQLWNVLKGDMSLVGPRPPLPEEVEQYDKRQYRRLSVNQGMTCFWQIADGHYGMPFDDWVDLDLKYVREQSAATDLKILIGTAAAVFRMSGW